MTEKNPADATQDPNLPPTPRQEPTHAARILYTPQPQLEALADMLETTLRHTSGADQSTVLITQSHTLDALFNRLLVEGFTTASYLRQDHIRLALIAQRQCAHTIEKLHRNEAQKRKFEKTAEQTEGPEN